MCIRDREGTTRVRINTFENAVSEAIGIEGSDQVIVMNYDASQVADGDEEYFEMEVAGGRLSVAGQLIEGDLSVGRVTDDRGTSDSSDDETALRLGARDVSASFGVAVLT